MASRLRIRIEKFTNDEHVKNVNNWFVKESQKVGIKNFSAVIRDNDLTVVWEHPTNSSLVYDLLIPVLTILKQYSKNKINVFSFKTGYVESNIEFLDYKSFLENIRPADSSMYPYSYKINTNNLGEYIINLNTAKKEG